jgi:hypothetical protein
MKIETYAKQWHKKVSQPRLRNLKAIASYKCIHQMMLLTSETEWPIQLNLPTLINL